MSAPEGRRPLAPVSITGVALLVLMPEPGCGRSPLSIPSTRAARTDGGADTGADAAWEPRSDAVVEPALDSGSEAALDADTDAALDSESDAALDADIDAAPRPQRNWQGPELIEDFADHSYGAHVVIDAEANVTATWRQYGGSERREGVGANRFDRKTKTWGQARYLDDGTRSTAMPTLAKDGAGNVMVVWEQTLDVGSTRHVSGTRFDIELGAWQAPGSIAQTTSEGMLDPIIGLGDDGNGVVVWLRSEPRHSVHAARFAGGSWQSAAKLFEQKSGNPGYPHLGVDVAGNATVLWVEPDGPNRGLFLRRMAATSGLWGESIALSSEGCFTPALAVAPSGQAAVTWTQPGGSEAQLHVAYASGASGRWGEEALPGAGPGASVYPSVAVANGAAMLVWQQGEAQGEVFASRRGPDGVWEQPVVLGNDAGSYTWPRVVFDGSNAAIAAWHEGPDGASRVVAARYDPSSDVWSEPVLLDNGAAAASNPKIAVNEAGLAVVIWEQEESPGRGHLWASRLE